MQTEKDITTEELLKYLPDTPYVHVFVEGADKAGEDWPMRMILEQIRKHGARLSPKELCAHGHGIETEMDGKKIWVQNKGGQRATT